MNSTTQTLQLIRHHLLGVSAVTDIVSDRVHTAHFYDFENLNVIFPLVVIEQTGGVGNYGMKAQRVEIEVYCYARDSSQKSKQLYDAVYQNLNGAGLKNSNVSVAGYVYEQTRPTSGFNPAAQAFYCSGTFIINTAG